MIYGSFIQNSLNPSNDGNSNSEESISTNANETLLPAADDFQVDPENEIIVKPEPGLFMFNISCDACDKEFPDDETFQAHLSENGCCPGEELNSVDPLAIPDSTSIPSKPDELFQRLKTENPASPPTPEDCGGPSRVITDVEQTFDTSSSAPSYACDICEFKDCTSQELCLHKLITHCQNISPSEVKIPCKCCGKKVMRRTLERHYESHFTLIDPAHHVYECKEGECGKKSYNKWAAIRHVQLKHTKFQMTDEIDKQFSR